MLYRVTAVAILACVLGGCTDANWDHTLSYVGIGEHPTETAQAAPAATAPTSAQPVPQDNLWCDAAAKSAAQESRDNGFDEATQRHEAESARRQCLHS